MKTVCIYHSIDLDGWMSAAIVKHWFESNKSKTNNDPLKSCNVYKEQGCSHVDGMLCNTKECYILHSTLDFIGYNYGQPIPDLSQYDKVIMCDISFPKDEMIKLWDIVGVENMIWIDHHISAIKEIQDTKWLWEGQQDTKFAACELTWKYFFPNEEMPEIVRLLGRYDCFGHKGTDEETKVLEFQYGARTYIKNYEDAYDFLVGNKVLQDSNDEPNTIEMMMLYGSSTYQYLCTEAKQAYKNGFDIKFMIPHPKYIGEGQYKLVRFICINKERFNPINFGIDYHKDGYDGAACFYFDGENYNFSLYNDNKKVDCSIIAKQFGGGGHAGAAGFRIKDTKQII